MPKVSDMLLQVRCLPTPMPTADGQLPHQEKEVSEVKLARGMPASNVVHRDMSALVQPSGDTSVLLTSPHNTHMAET